jgi:hypothetical protein
MKLRFRANTVRIRLLQGEVARLAAGEAIVETLPTPRPLHFRVEPGEVDDMSADFEGDCLTVIVPCKWSAGWAASDEVGRQALSRGIDILIEKDWACTTPRVGEEGLDVYVNPTIAPEAL